MEQRNWNLSASPTTEYVVCYFALPGGWHQSYAYLTFRRARVAAAEINAPQWYIEKRVRSVLQAEAVYP